jgi:hypothetical protein
VDRWEAIKHEKQTRADHAHAAYALMAAVARLETASPLTQARG